MKRGFDIAESASFIPRGNPDVGVSHMVAHPIPTLVPDLDIPIIPLFLNEYYPPLPTAERCYDLGETIAEVMAERPERVAIYASGGLSHDPGGRVPDGSMSPWTAGFWNGWSAMMARR